MAEDQIVIEYKAKVDKLEADLLRIEKDLKGVDSASKKSMGTLEREGRQAAKSVDKVNKEVTGLSSKLGNLANNIPGVFAVQEVLGFGNAVVGSTKSVGGLTTGMKALRVVMYSTVGIVAALLIPFIALIAYFKRTDDGATKLEGIMGALGAATDEVTGFMAELGDRVYEAATSFDSFKDLVIDASKEIGLYILGRIGAPVILIIDLFKAAGKAIDRDFKGATQAAADATIRFATGFNNVTGTLSKFGDKMAKAAKEAYEFALAMDANSDAQRELNVEISENTIRITELIRQSKNHSLSIDERRKKLELANAIEAYGLRKTLEIEQEKLILLEGQNKREQLSINQKNAGLIARLDEIKTLKLEAKTQDELNKLKIEEDNINTKLLSINDEASQRVADQQIKINGIKQQSIALTERNNNAIAALNEAAIQEEIAEANKKIIVQQNIQKEAYVKGEIDQKTYLRHLADATIKALENERQILIKYKRSTEEIDAKILDIKIKNKEDEIKEKEKSDADFAAFEKELNDDIDKTQAQARDIKHKKDEEAEKQHQANIKAILSESITFAGNLLNAISQRKLENDLAEIESERNKNQLSLNSAIASIDKKQEAGLLSEKSAAAQKEALQKKAAVKESLLKKKQFESQKKADLTQILINTAVAIAKTLAVYGFTPAAAIAAGAAAAEGALQYGIVASKKTPQFKDGVIDFKGKGTGTSDENHVMISNHESIIKAKQTQKYKGLLGAINDDRVDDYFMKDPAGIIMAKQVKERLKEKQLSELALRSQVNRSEIDLNHLERLVKNNKSVKLENTRELAKLIGRELGNNNSEMK